MELNEKLVALRKKKGMSQAELAEAIKVSRQAISRWEVGTAIPSADNLMWLSKFYEVSMDELMGVVTDSDQEVEVKEDQNTYIKTRKPIKSLVIACALILIVAVAIWIGFHWYQGANEKSIGLQELESTDHISDDVVDMDIDFDIDIKSTNP